MSDSKHPVWRLAAIAFIGAIGLGYCHKDGGLIALITAASTLATKYLGGTSEG